MAELFHETGAFSFRSPISMDTGFRKTVIGVNQASLAALELLCHRILTSLGCPAFVLGDYSVCAVFEAECRERVLSWFRCEKRRLESLCTDISGCDQPVVINIEDDDEVSVGSLLRAAVHCSLSSTLISKGWALLGNNVFVFGDLPSQQEQTPMEVISVDVQLLPNDNVVLLLSADVACFHRVKPLENMSNSWLKRFEAGKPILIDDYRWFCEEGTETNWECRVLPTLREGHVLEVSKCLAALDSNELDRSRHQWLYKNGIHLEGDYHYIKVRLDMDPKESAWFPSSLVVTKAGLVPAVRSYRCSRLLRVVEHFKKDITGWEFFNSGNVSLEELRSASFLGETSKLLLHPSETPPVLTGLEITTFSNVDLEKSLRARQKQQIGLEAAPEVRDKEAAPATAKQGEPLPARFLTLKSRGASATSKPGPNKGSSPKSNQLSQPSGTVRKQSDASLASALRRAGDKENFCGPVAKRSRRDDAGKVKGAKGAPHGEPNKTTTANDKTKQRKDASTDDSIEAAVRRRHAEGKLKELNVADLKCFLRLKKCKVGGKKDELLERVRALLV